MRSLALLYLPNVYEIGAHFACSFALIEFINIQIKTTVHVRLHTDTRAYTEVLKYGISDFAKQYKREKLLSQYRVHTNGIAT